MTDLISSFKPEFGNERHRIAAERVGEMIAEVERIEMSKVRDWEKRALSIRIKIDRMIRELK